jgi:predicted nucleic-acid-binding Zn-ribbon protein
MPLCECGHDVPEHHTIDSRCGKCPCKKFEQRTVDRMRDVLKDVVSKASEIDRERIMLLLRSTEADCRCGNFSEETVRKIVMSDNFEKILKGVLT